MITNYQKHSILQMRRGGMTSVEIGEALDAVSSLPATETGNGSSAGGSVICSAVMGRDCPNGQGTAGA